MILFLYGKVCGTVWVLVPAGKPSFSKIVLKPVTSFSVAETSATPPKCLGLSFFSVWFCQIRLFSSKPELINAADTRISSNASSPCYPAGVVFGKAVRPHRQRVFSLRDGSSNLLNTLRQFSQQLVRLVLFQQLQYHVASRLQRIALRRSQLLQRRQVRQQRSGDVAFQRKFMALVSIFVLGTVVRSNVGFHRLDSGQARHRILQGGSIHACRQRSLSTRRRHAYSAAARDASL